MIALDTNVLVRYLVRDDPLRSDIAQEILEGLTDEEPGFISREVAMETAWVLERAYKFSREQVAGAILELTGMRVLVLEAVSDIMDAALSYGRGRPDFADLLVLAAARRAGAHPLYTFDLRLAEEEGAALAGA